MRLGSASGSGPFECISFRFLNDHPSALLGRGRGDLSQWLLSGPQGRETVAGKMGGTQSSTAYSRAGEARAFWDEQHADWTVLLILPTPERGQLINNNT